MSSSARPNQSMRGLWKAPAALLGALLVSGLFAGLGIEETHTIPPNAQVVIWNRPDGSCQWWPSKDQMTATVFVDGPDKVPPEKFTSILSQLEYKSYEEVGPCKLPEYLRSSADDLTTSKPTPILWTWLGRSQSRWRQDGSWRY